MISRNSKLRIVGLLSVVALVLAACGPQPTAAPTEAPVEAPAEVETGVECPIVIGAALHMTGQTAIYDMPPWNAARLAVKEINEAGGILGCPIKLVELDGKSDPAKVGDAAEVAVQQGAQILVAPCDFDKGSPVSIVAQDHGMVGISECAGSPLYSSTVLGDKQFTMGIWVNNLSATIAEYAIKELGMQTAVTIKEVENDFSMSMGNYFNDAWQHHGGEIVLDIDYHLGDMTFASQIDKILALPEPPDAILLGVEMPDAAVVVREVRAAGIDAAFLNASALDVPDFYGAVGEEAGDNIYISAIYLVSEESGPDMTHFLEIFEEEYGERPVASFSVFGYDLIYVLKQAIEKAGTVEGGALSDAMEETTFDVIDSTFSWSSAEDGHVPSKGLVILKVQDAVPSFVESYEATYVPPVD